MDLEISNPLMCCHNKSRVYKIKGVYFDLKVEDCPFFFFFKQALTIPSKGMELNVKSVG